MDNAPTKVWSGKITKQGLRDLNSYGPRPGKGVAEVPLEATVADEQTVPKEGAPVTSAIGENVAADDEGVLK